MIKPDPSSRHPLVVFLLALCLLSSGGMLLGGGQTRPGTLEASLPEWQVTAWAVGLLLGSVLTLTGIILQPTRLRDGVLLEQVGMAALAPAAIIYAGAAFGQVGWGAFLSAGIIFSLGLACGYRWWTLQRDINKSKRLLQEAAGTE